MRKNLYPASLRSSGIGLNMFGECDKAHLHAAVLEVLNTIGIRFECDEALAYLDGAGAVVNFDTQVVRFPEYLVNDALASAPNGLIMYGKTPEYDAYLGEGRVNWIPFGSGIYVEDLETGEIRSSKKSDQVDCTRIIDALDEYDVCMETVVPQDVPAVTAPLHSFEAHVSNTNKNVTVGPADKRTAEAVIQMAAAVAGGLDQLQERPLFNFGGCSISPLMMPDSTCQAIMVGARNNVPVGCLSMAMAGGTSPVTLEGTIVVALAEVISGVVLSQIVKKGAPILIGTSTCTMDLRHNAAAMVGTPELALISSSFAQMGQYYGIPSLVAGT